MKNLILVAGALAVFVVTACGSGAKDGPACDRLASVAGLTLADAIAPGAYPVGKHGVTLFRDGFCYGEGGNLACERELRVDVYYPATEAGDDTPVAAGSFPLVVYSHGFMSSLAENAGLLRVLASRGYVAAAPSFPNTSLGSDTNLFDVVNQPGDVSFLIDWLLDLDEPAPNPVSGAVDEAHIITGGLSLGGMTTLLTTYHGGLRDERISAAFALAPPTAMFTSAFYETTTVPFLLIAGSEDAVVAYPENGAAGFERMLAPAEFMTLVAGSHLGFTEQGVFLGGGVDHPDSIACLSLDGQVTDEGDPGGWDDLAELGGEAYGVDFTAEFGTTCDGGDLPLAMRPQRQLDLTIASVVSFLEARVGGSEAYGEFLALGIPGDDCDAVYESK
jgi:pimeloyl-ACP methyl ester carboxylesterase